MAATYLGSFSVGGAVPGLSSAFEAVGDALTDLHGVASQQLTLLADVIAGIGAQRVALDAAAIAIRIPATADLEIALQAAISLAAGFTAQLSNPAAYLSALLNGLVATQNNLNATLPTVQLNAQVAGANANKLTLEGKIAAIDLQLSALGTIGLALSALRTIVVNVRAALSAAVAAVLAAIGTLSAMLDLLAAAGAHCFIYDGTLAGLGAAIDLETPDSGISGAVTVRVPLVVVRADNPQGLGAVNAVFRVS